MSAGWGSPGGWGTPGGWGGGGTGGSTGGTSGGVYVPPPVSPEPVAPSVSPLSPFIVPRTSAWGSAIPVSVGNRVIAGRFLDLDPNRRQQGVSVVTGLTYSHVSVQYSFGYGLLEDVSEVHVAKAWADGRLFYDLDAGLTTPGWVIGSDLILQVGDQTAPHPYFEALRGTDGAPCYQKQIVLTHADQSLEFFSEQPPTISLELRDKADGSRPLVKDILTLLARRSSLYAASDLVFVGMDTLDMRGLIFDQNIDFKGLLPLFGRWFGIDWVEAGGKLKFIKRGDADFAPDFTFDVRDLMPTSEEGGFRTSRRDEEELPAQISVQYLDESIQFKPSTQQARLEQEPARVVQSRRQEQLSVPFVASATEAMTAASHILDREAAQAISHGPANLPPSFLAMEPGDILQADDETHSFIMKASSVTINSDNSITWQAFGVQTVVDYTRTGYAGSPAGAPVYTSPITGNLAAALPGYGAAFLEAAPAITGDLVASLPGYTAAFAAINSGVNNSTFGSTGTGTIRGVDSANTARVQAHAVPSGGTTFTLNKMAVMETTGSSWTTGAKFRAVVYEYVNSTTGGALVGSSDEYTITGAEVDFSTIELLFSSPPVLAPGSTYWFGIHASHATTLEGADLSGSRQFGDTYADGPLGTMPATSAASGNLYLVMSGHLVIAPISGDMAATLSAYAASFTDDSTPANALTLNGDTLTLNGDTLTLN